MGKLWTWSAGLVCSLSVGWSASPHFIRARKQETTRHISECKGSTVKGLTIKKCKQMIGKEGPQTDDINSVRSVEIVRKKMEERTKIKTIVNKYGWEDNSPLQRSLRQRIRQSSSSSSSTFQLMQKRRLVVVSANATNRSERECTFSRPHRITF